jgi:hypothetical protein
MEVLTQPAGHAAPDPPKQGTTFLLYWRKPEEWGTLIYNWVRQLCCSKARGTTLMLC